MNRRGTRRRRTVTCLKFALAAAFAAGTAAAKPPAAVYADVEITFAGQTFGFSGPEQSFSQSASGGRIAFDLQQLQTPGYVPLPPVDVGTLEPAGNYWIVQQNLNRGPYVFTGTCASETYTTRESGVVVRHLHLNCSEFDAGAAP